MLNWLKSNNPLWGNFIILDEQLDLYPDEDRVLQEMRAVTKYSDDVTAVVKHAGYMMEDEDR